MAILNTLKGHALDAGDTMLSGGARHINRVAGTFQGQMGYRRAYGELKTVHARHAIDEKALAKNSRKLNRARRHILSKFSEENFSKLVQRFQDHPEKMQKKSDNEHKL